MVEKFVHLQEGLGWVVVVAVGSEISHEPEPQVDSSALLRLQVAQYWPVEDQ